MRLFIVTLTILFSWSATACDRAIYASHDFNKILIGYLEDSEDEMTIIIVNNKVPKACTAEWHFGMASWVTKCGNEEPFRLGFHDEGATVLFDNIELHRRCVDE